MEPDKYICTNMYIYICILLPYVVVQGRATLSDPPAPHNSMTKVLAIEAVLPHIHKDFLLQRQPALDTDTVGLSVHVTWA